MLSNKNRNAMQLDPSSNFIKAILKNSDISNKTILEIGCGSGRITRDLAKYAKSVIAIDPDAQSLQKAINAIKFENVTFIKGSGEDLSFLKNKVFDVVVYSLSLHHIPHKQMKSSLVQATELLKKSGEIIVIEPDKKGSLIKAEEQFNVGDGDETFVKQQAIEAVNSLENWKIIKKDNFNTLFYFDDETDFFKNMLNNYQTKPTSELLKIEEFLNQHKTDGKIILSADRYIAILKKI